MKTLVFNAGASDDVFARVLSHGDNEIGNISFNIFKDGEPDYFVTQSMRGRVCKVVGDPSTPVGLLKLYLAASLISDERA